MSMPPPFKHHQGLGQHFLVDQDILERIADNCEIKAGENVLEVGPGEGALTAALLDRGAVVTAVETDHRLLKPLSERFEGRFLSVHHQDILRFDIQSLPRPVKIIGNLPYNISTPFLEKILVLRRSIGSLFITVQKEFGQRLMAAPGAQDYSALSCLLAMFAAPRILFRIPSRAFRPCPRVESCFMRIDMLQTPAFPVLDEEKFIRLVHGTFFQRRKTILNALAPGHPKDVLGEVLDKAGVNRKARPEVLGAADYARIANNL